MRYSKHQSTPSWRIAAPPARQPRRRRTTANGGAAADSFPSLPWQRGAASAARTTTEALLLHEVHPAPLPAREPPARDGLLAGVELDRVGAVGVEVAEEGVLPAGEREEGDGGGNADVDADHADLDVVAEATDRRAGLGEDRHAVAEATGVDDLDRLVERGDVDHAEHGPEDLLLRDGHLGLDVVEDRRRDVGAVGGKLPLRLAAVDGQRGALGDAAVDPLADAVAGGGRDDRADVDALLDPVAHLQVGGRLAQRGHELVVGIADRDHHRPGHATLAGRAETGGDQAVDGLVHDGVGHDDHVVLGPAERLDALAG